MIQLIFKKLFRLRENAARRPGADEGFDPYEKPFLDHLDDLRVTLFKIIGTLVIATCVCFIFNKEIFQLVQLPAKSHFAEIAPGVTLYEKLELIPLAPTEVIFLMFKLAFYCGAILTFPFTVFFLFQFLLPGLRQIEKRAVVPGVAAGFLLFILGGSFAFFLATPFALGYFYKFENERLSATDPASQAMARPASEIALIGLDGVHIPPAKKQKAGKEHEASATTVEQEAKSQLAAEMREEMRTFLREHLATAEGANFALRYDEVRDKIILVTAKGGKSSYQISRYISFVSQLVIVFGLSFQMPVIVTILVKLGLLTAQVMRNTRSYAWVIIVVLAAILTPSPDAFTMGLLGVPLILLYEICIIISTVIERGRRKQEEAEEAAERERREHLYLKPASELSEEEKAELHRAEIEQYEKEHEHRYEEESNHVARDTFYGDADGDNEVQDADDELHPDSPEAQWSEGMDADGDSGNHDESWHESTRTPSPSSEAGNKNEWDSDHVEPEDLTPGEGDEGEEGENAQDARSAKENASESAVESSDEISGSEEQAEPTTQEDPNENCAPDGPVVDFNHATWEELQTLPGIGPDLAQIVIDHRPYDNFADLENIPGFDDELIRRITDRISLGEEE